MGGRERLRESLIGSHSHPPHYTEHCLAISSETKRKEKKKAPLRYPTPNTKHRKNAVFISILSLSLGPFSLSIYISWNGGIYREIYIYSHT